MSPPPPLRHLHKPSNLTYFALLYTWKLGQFLFDLILFVPVNNFSVISTIFQLCRRWTSSKQGLWHNTVLSLNLEPATPRSRVGIQKNGLIKHLWLMDKKIIIFLDCKCLLKRPDLQIRVRTGKKKFLFPNQNKCCGYSKEPSQWDSYRLNETVHLSTQNTCLNWWVRK